MKKFNFICCFLLVFATQIYANDLTPAQEKAQTALYVYLDKNRYNPEVDDNDNSVCFRLGGVLYWINIDEESPILYTIHRKGFKIGTDESSYRRNAAIVAANYVNGRHKAIKLVVKEKKVDITMQVYASNTESFTAVLANYLKEFEKVDEDFKSAYKTAKKAENDAAEKAEQEARKNLPPSVLREQVSGISFRLLDTDGKENTAYDKPLRSFNAKYIQARIEFLPWRNNDEKFNLQLKITRPDGNPIYLPGKKITAEQEVTIQKSKKNQMIEINRFGTDKVGFWKAGEYKVELIEGGDIIYTTTFNIL